MSMLQLYLVSRLRTWWLELLTLRLDTSVHDPVASKEKQQDLESKLSRGTNNMIYMHANLNTQPFFIPKKQNIKKIGP
jgi:hypothetical protein